MSLWIADWSGMDKWISDIDRVWEHLSLASLVSLVWVLCFEKLSRPGRCPGRTSCRGCCQPCAPGIRSPWCTRPRSRECRERATALGTATPRHRDIGHNHVAMHLAHDIYDIYHHLPSSTQHDSNMTPTWLSLWLSVPWAQQWPA